MTGADAPRFSRFARVRSRRSIVQAYYQWQIAKQPIKEIIREFEADRGELKKADREYFTSVLLGMTRDSRYLDELLTPYLDRPVTELDPVERAILHLGCYELHSCPEIPWRSVINESVELARMFGAEQSHKYINGILDRLAQDLRSVEISAGP